jgi:hypothetical protein
MSDLWINWRFGIRHLQIGPWFIRIDVNPYHIANKPDKYFERY